MQEPKPSPRKRSEYHASKTNSAAELTIRSRWTMARWVSGLPNVTLIYAHCTLTWVSGLPTSQFGLSSLHVVLSVSLRMITVRAFCYSADWLLILLFYLFSYFLGLPHTIMLSLPMCRLCAPFGTCVLGPSGRCADRARTAQVAHACILLYAFLLFCLLPETLFGVRIE